MMSPPSSCPTDAVASASSIAQDQLHVMLRQEVTTYKTRDYLDLLMVLDEQPEKQHRGLLAPSTQRRLAPGAISKQWREIICEWAYKLVDYFQCPREVVGVAMHLVDRYLGSSSSSLPGSKSNRSYGSSFQVCSKRDFKLVCLACLYLALKTERPAAVSLETLLSLSRDVCSSEELLSMEQDILCVLQWRLHPPTAFAFLEYYQQNLLMLPSMHVQQHKDVVRGILNDARYMVELSVIDYFFVKHRSSHVALGALLCAVDNAEVSLLQHCSPSQSVASGIEQYQFLVIFQSLQTRIHGLMLDDDASAVTECRLRLDAIYEKTVASAPSRRATYKRTATSASPTTVMHNGDPAILTQHHPNSAIGDGERGGKRLRFSDTEETANKLASGAGANTNPNALFRMISPVQVAMLLDNLAGSGGNDAQQVGFFNRS